MTRPWWHGAVVYQVYVRSFCDSDGDGIGDLDGVRSRLEYLRGLGIDALWLTPVYPSPLCDGGYDITDYTDVATEYGGLEALDRLVDKAHALGMRVLLDWVPNHTSHEHPWFLDARRGVDSPHRDFYVWAHTSPDRPPNNWLSAFDEVGPAWSWDERTRAWYLHSFLPEQPDLNWDNPCVEQAMHDVLRFWLDRGIDGFRIDVAQCLGKDPQLRDNPVPVSKPTAETAGRRYDEDHWPTLMPRLEGLREVIDAYDDRITVAEAYVLDPVRLSAFTAPGRLHLAHNFMLLGRPWAAGHFRAAIEASLDAAGADGWISWVIGNHDHPRVASRWRRDGTVRPRADSPLSEVEPELGQRRAAVAALLQMTLPGTPFIYQGDELGLPDTPVPGDRALDVDGRDPARTRLPWDSRPVHDPGKWLPMAEVPASRTAARQETDTTSMLSWYRRLLALRRSHPALLTVDTELMDVPAPLLAYHRTSGDRAVTAVAHFGGEPHPWPREPGTEVLAAINVDMGDDRFVLGDVSGVIIEHRSDRVHRASAGERTHDRGGGSA